MRSAGGDPRQSIRTRAAAAPLHRVVPPSLRSVALKSLPPREPFYQPIGHGIKSSASTAHRLASELVFAKSKTYTRTIKNLLTATDCERESRPKGLGAKVGSLIVQCRKVKLAPRINTSRSESIHPDDHNRSNGNSKSRAISSRVMADTERPIRSAPRFSSSQSGVHHPRARTE